MTQFLRLVAMTTLAVAAGSVVPASQTQAFDLLISGGRVLDGTGNPWYYADVGVRDGRVTAIGTLTSATAARTVDATGMFVTPGFIDIHSHADRGLGRPGLRHAPNLVAQGITTVVVNQDGRSPNWPIRGQREAYDTDGIGPNAALMVGHGTIRSQVMGDRDNEVATEADVVAMQALVDEGMRDGAFGLSSGLEYDPGRYSETSEVVALARAVKPYGGFYISHERSEGADPMWKVKSDPSPFVSLLEAVQETITIGRESGVPVVASHLKAKGAGFWGSSVAATRLIQAARDEGVEVYADQYPYETSGTDGSTVLIPGWALRPEGGSRGDQLTAGATGGRGGGPPLKDVFRERLANDEDARRIRLDIAHEIDRRGGAGRIIINDFPDEQYVGRTLQHVVDDRESTPVDAVIWLQLNGYDRAGGARMRGFSMSEMDLDHIMQQDFTATCTDGETVILGQGTPHARFYGTMPRKLRYYALDRGVITLPFAVRSMTSLPAQIMGLRDRGVLRVGAAADLVVFDPATVADTATFAEPHQYPIGIPWVFVNGEAVVAEGELTSATPGRVLTPSQDGMRVVGDRTTTGG